MTSFYSKQYTVDYVNNNMPMFNGTKETVFFLKFDSSKYRFLGDYYPDQNLMGDDYTTIIMAFAKTPSDVIWCSSKLGNEDARWFELYLAELVDRLSEKMMIDSCARWQKSLDNLAKYGWFEND